MEKGIKFSNQIYPATKEQIISQAEYIHDSEWENENQEDTKKDQQSINEKLKNRINSSKIALNNSIQNLSATLNSTINQKEQTLLSYVNNNISGLINKVTPGLGLQQTEESQCTIGSDNKITNITNNELAICDTLFRFRYPNEDTQDEDTPDDNTPDDNTQDNETQDDSYAGYIQGYTPGDFNGDTKVGIEDVTAILNVLLSNDSDSFPRPESFSVILTPKNQNNLTIKYLGDQNSVSSVTSKEFKIKFTGINLEEFIINNTTQEEQTTKKTSIKREQSLIEKKLAILDSYQKYNNTSENQNTTTKYGFQFEIIGYTNNNEQYVPADQFISGGTYSVIINNVNDLENIDYQNIQVKLVDKKVVQKQTTGGQIEYVLEDDFNTTTDINITINDPNNLLRLMYPGEGLKIEQVTYLMEAILSNSFINIFSLFGAGYFMYANDNTPINGCPGLIYQAIAKDGKEFRFISYGEYNKVYPFLLSDADLTYIVDHLKNSIIVDEDSADKQITRYNIGASFIKYSDQDLIDAYNGDGIPNLFQSQSTKIINLSNINDIVKVPIYLYDIPHIAVRDNSISYSNEFNGKILTFQSENPQKLWLVNNSGEKIDYIDISNINNDYPIFTLQLKFNPDLNIYRYNNGYFEFDEDVNISFNGRGILNINCRITSI